MVAVFILHLPTNKHTITFSFRLGKRFLQLLKKYGTIDIIGGEIADDQTARTLQQYIGGVDFGIPGTPKADKAAIEKLLPNRLKDQFCFRTHDAVNHLEFIRSDRYGDVKL